MKHKDPSKFLLENYHDRAGAAKAFSHLAESCVSRHKQFRAIPSAIAFEIAASKKDVCAMSAMPGRACARVFGAEEPVMKESSGRMERGKQD